MPEPIPEDELLGELTRLADELGHTPSLTDLREHGKQTPSAYYGQFDSWNAAKEAAGLETERGRPSISREELIEELLQMDIAHPWTPTTTDVQLRSDYSLTQFFTEFERWDDAREAAGLNTDAPTDTIPESGLLEDLRRTQSTLSARGELTEGYMSGDQYDRHGSVSSSTIIRRLDGWTDALSRAGLPSQAKRSSQNKYTKSELLSEIQRLADDLDRETPRLVDMKNHGKYSSSVYPTRFDTWNDAVEAAGLDTN